MEFPIAETLPATRLFLAVLLHFVWQATFVVMLVAIIRSLIHPRYCQLRYVLSVIGLGAVLLFPMMTLAYYTWNTDATLSLFRNSTGTSIASVSVSQSPTLIGQLESRFQIVFAWFDSHRFYWLGGWMIGFGLLALRLSVSLAHCFRLRRSQKPLPPRLQELAERLKEKLGLTQNMIIGVSQDITQAVAIGIIRPVVLLPAAWVTQLPISAIEAVLAHELAHVKRWDLWINFLQRFTETVFFFHPLVWWLSQKIANEREVCCDQLAVRITGQPMRYVETLSYVAGNKNLDEFEFQFGTAFSGGKNMNLLRRAKLILEPAAINAYAPFRTLVLIAGVGMLISYGSFAYSAGAISAIPSNQDEGHAADHDHENHEGHDEEGRQDKRDYGAETAVAAGISWLVAVQDEDGRWRDGDDEKDFRNHLTELLHRNEMGTVSHQELAIKLRQLADHLESGNPIGRSEKKVRAGVENRERRVDPRQFQNRMQDRPVDTRPDRPTETRPDRPVRVERAVRDRFAADRDFGDMREVEREVDSDEDGRSRVRDVVRETLIRIENQESQRRYGVEAPSQERRSDFRDNPEREFGARSVHDGGGELGQVLRELRNEMQELRREVDRLKSDRDLRPRDENRGTLRRLSNPNDNEFERQDGREWPEPYAEKRAEYQLRRGDAPDK